MDQKARSPRTKNGNPFFLYFATPHIHHPFTPGARFKGSSEADAYGDFIQEFDWMVGEVMRTLDELKLATARSSSSPATTVAC
jgi:arylsulfatase A